VRLDDDDDDHDAVDTVPAQLRQQSRVFSSCVFGFNYYRPKTNYVTAFSSSKTHTTITSTRTSQGTLSQYRKGIT